MEGFKIIDPNRFEYRTSDRLVEFHVHDGVIHYEDGPAEQTARSHEAMGGSQKIQTFINDPYPWIYDYPGLHERVCAHLDHAVL